MAQWPRNATMFRVGYVFIYGDPLTRGGGALRRSPAHGEMFLGNDDKDVISTILQREHLVAIVKMPESEVYDESMPSRQHSPMQKEVFSKSSLLLRARWALKSMADNSKSEASENAESSVNSGTRLVGAIQSFQTKLKRRIEVLRRGLSVKSSSSWLASTARQHLPPLLNMVGVLFFILLLSVPLASADLAVGFYDSSCPQAETVVRAVVTKHFHADHSIAAAFLRLYFHDCFVRGCDASILIDGTNTTDSEKSAFPNKTVRGYEIIDDIKQNLEGQCPSTVSCADVIALATRDVVALARGLNYAVPTGRRDGLMSNPADVALPGPSSPMSVIQQAFGPKGFTLEETVVLLGAHTSASTMPHARTRSPSSSRWWRSTSPPILRPAALLRMYFHDCFVRGCDASILIAPTKKKTTERSAGPNQTVRGFDIIDEAKSSLETQCPGTCRLDGLISNPNDVNLPGPQLTVSQALAFFTNKGFTLDDMVVLLGGHTVGVAHCTFFRDRLGNFQGTGQPDRSMDPALLAKLKETCGPRAKPLKSDPTAFLDQNTSFAVDNSYYSQIVQKRGVMQIDQELADDNSTAATVQGLAADAAGFARRFADALVRLGSVEIKQDSDGEIRRSCQAFNTRSTKP
uniref:peroxidase n=1 Tax=Ananas comosus var. bracteatus TaxID=296719 RepID=A0A6V7QKB5_ANACO|nr:unnamed protein product [Ananas comosus var. bracteatus]